MKVSLWTHNSLSICQHTVCDRSDEGFLLGSFSLKSMVTNSLVSCDHTTVSRFAEEITCT